MSQQPRKNELMHRYELTVEGQVAYLSWEEQADGVLAFNHTFVPSELRGRNLAAILTKYALEDARAHSRRVAPQCSYVATYMQRNQEYADLRADGPTTAGLQ